MPPSGEREAHRRSPAKAAGGNGADLRAVPFLLSGEQLHWSCTQCEDGVFTADSHHLHGHKCARRPEVVLPLQGWSLDISFKTECLYSCSGPDLLSTLQTLTDHNHHEMLSALFGRLARLNSGTVVQCIKEELQDQLGQVPLRLERPSMRS